LPLSASAQGIKLKEKIFWDQRIPASADFSCAEDSREEFGGGRERRE